MYLSLYSWDIKVAISYCGQWDGPYRGSQDVLETMVCFLKITSFNLINFRVTGDFHGR